MINIFTKQNFSLALLRHHAEKKESEVEFEPDVDRYSQYDGRFQGNPPFNRGRHEWSE